MDTPDRDTPKPGQTSVVDVVNMPWNIDCTLHMWKTNSAAFHPGQAGTSEVQPELRAASTNRWFSSASTCR